MAKLAVESYPMDSSFRNSMSILTGARRNISGSVRRISSSKDQDPVDMKYIFQQYVERTASELQAQRILAAELDRVILEKLTGFIKHHEPQIRTTLERFEELFGEYKGCYDRMENLKQKYQSFVRLGEMAGQEHRREHEEIPEETERSPIETPPRQKTIMEAETPEIPPGLGLEFPLVVGGVLRLDDVSELDAFLSAAIEGISTVRRKIPFPGYRNEIFSSNQLCEWLTKNRPYGFNPTQLNLEKLGQALLDMKILVGSGVFAKKFRSDNMWFEWSEPAVRSSLSEVTISIDAVSLPSQRLNRLTLDESTSKYLNDVALSTSKSFNGMFQTMKTSLMKPKYLDEGIREVEANYNETYEELQRLKHLLDLEIFDKSQMFEKFEKLKIEVVYQTLTKLLEIIYNNAVESTTLMRDFTSRFINDLNKPEHYANDFQRTLEQFSTGIYFPSIVSPDVLTNRHLDTSQLNTNFQNIKLSFNLYKDISLQVKLPQSDPLLSLQSIPHFLFRLIELVEAVDISELRQLWLEPVKHQDYWLVKYEIINAVQQYTPSQEVNIHEESAIELAMINMVVDLMKEKSASRIINFLKNWLLEISDAIIPCLVFDALIMSYSNKESSPESLQAETVRILSAIPRSNLGSLVYILEHVSKVFALGELPGYGSSDEIGNTLPQQDIKAIEEAVKVLNSMQAIATVPFLHLIFRPSVVKNASGFKPPTREYNLALKDLLNLTVRSKLLSSLVANERHFIERQKLQKKNLGLRKISVEKAPETTVRVDSPKISEAEATPVTPTKAVITSTFPKSPKPLAEDSFALRPFKTGLTPRPSPSSSPSHSKKLSFSHVRSTSSTFLTPNVDLQYEN